MIDLDNEHTIFLSKYKNEMPINSFGHNILGLLSSNGFETKFENSNLFRKPFHKFHDSEL